MFMYQVHCTSAPPHRFLPWQKEGIERSTSRFGFYCFVQLIWGRLRMSSTLFGLNYLFCSAFMIGGGKLLTNAHCVRHWTHVISLSVIDCMLSHCHFYWAWMMFIGLCTNYSYVMLGMLFIALQPECRVCTSNFLLEFFSALNCSLCSWLPLHSLI